jgi:sugar/nucleoside kinase (ribokinase family)
MTDLSDVAAIGNAIVDVIAPCGEAFLEAEGLTKGSMQLIDQARATELYARMARPVVTSGGSAANTVAGVASFGGKASFLGKVAADRLGAAFVEDMWKIGAQYRTEPLRGAGPSTARCLINVTPDGERTMCTYLGASTHFADYDVDREFIEGAKIVYLEGYLFDPPDARAAFAKAAGLARASGRQIALTLSDSFVVERHRGALMGFIENQVDVLFANEAEICALFQCDFGAAVTAVRSHARIAALTRSEHGSVVVSGANTHAIPAVPVEKVVDTTGAGDQYAAGFLFGLARGRPLEDCGRLGSMAAAEVISHYGPRPQVSLSELAAAQGLV